MPTNLYDVHRQWDRTLVVAIIDLLSLCVIVDDLRCYNFIMYPGFMA